MTVELQKDICVGKDCGLTVIRIKGMPSTCPICGSKMKKATKRRLDRYIRKTYERRLIGRRAQTDTLIKMAQAAGISIEEAAERLKYIASVSSVTIPKYTESTGRL